MAKIHMKITDISGDTYEYIGKKSERTEIILQELVKRFVAAKVYTKVLVYKCLWVSPALGWIYEKGREYTSKIDRDLFQDYWKKRKL